MSPFRSLNIPNNPNFIPATAGKAEMLVDDVADQTDALLPVLYQRIVTAAQNAAQ